MSEAYQIAEKMVMELGDKKPSKETIETLVLLSAGMDIEERELLFPELMETVDVLLADQNEGALSQKDGALTQ